MTSNWLELGLSETEEKMVRAAAAIYKTTYLDTIDNVFTIATALEILRRRHLSSGLTGGFTDALVQYGFTARDGGPMNKALRSHLKTLLEHEPQVRAWWAGVPERQKRDWLSAKAVYTHWTASLKPKDAPRKPSPYVQMKETNITLQEQLQSALDENKTFKRAEATPAAGASQELAAAREEIAKLKAELAAAKAAPVPQEALDIMKRKLEYEYEVRACKLENEYIARMAKQARDSVTVQISGDVQMEVNRWLGVLLPELHKERSKARRAVAKRKRVVTKAAFNKLLNAVHPDTGRHATVKDRDAATRVLIGLRPFVLDEADEPTTTWDSDLPNDLAGWAKRMQDAELKRRMSDIPNPRAMPLPPFLEPKGRGAT
jgi:hypothetical protein